MSDYKPSLSDRKKKLLEELKEEAGAMVAGDGGFTASADAGGPVAGFDPVMGGTRKKFDKLLQKRRNEQQKQKAKTEEVEFSESEIEALTEKLDGKSAKDKDYSLHDWFKGGGWKQTGGKYDGKPCAKQPGQTTKPFCRDADDRASMSKDERERRAAKKRREDPNPDRKGKAKNVTEENLEEKKDACYRKVKARYDVWPSAYASGALVKCRKRGAKNWGNKSKKKD
jgi:hypothetical protein